MNLTICIIKIAHIKHTYVRRERCKLGERQTVYELESGKNSTRRRRGREGTGPTSCSCRTAARHILHMYSPVKYPNLSAHVSVSVSLGLLLLSRRARMRPFDLANLMRFASPKNAHTILQVSVWFYFL